MKYTIPLVFEDRYFLVELYDRHEAWTVFSVHLDNILVDFFRNSPRQHQFGHCEIDGHGALIYREKQANNWLYKIEINQCSSAISIVYSQTILTHGVEDGCLILGGPLCVVNTAEAGVGIPVGMFSSRDYKIDFRRELPKILIKQLVDRS